MVGWGQLGGQDQRVVLGLGDMMGLAGMGQGWRLRLGEDRAGDKAGGAGGGGRTRRRVLVVPWAWGQARLGALGTPQGSVLQGDEPSDSILLPQPLHKDKPGTPQTPPPSTRHPPIPPHGAEPLTLSLCPGFALLLARDAPHPQLPGGTSPPAEDEDLSPHAV